MNIYSFNNDIQFDENRIQTKVLIETSFSKEIRIILKKGQLMKEHKAPFPILIHVLDGLIEFGVEGSLSDLKTGDVIALEGGVPHSLNAKENTIIRLTLSKQDKVERVQEVVKDHK